MTKIKAENAAINFMYGEEVAQDLLDTMAPKTDEISQTLAERGSKYGPFSTHAEYAEQINNVYESSPNWKFMKADSKESLRIIANKIGRILNGDPEYDDNWRDIAGYAKLVLDRING